MKNRRFIYQKLKQVLLHLLFWLGVLLFYTYVFGVDNKIYSSVFYFSLFMMPVTIGTTYVSIYKLIPEYLITKRYVQFTIYSIYTLIISVFAISFSIFFSLAYLSDFKFENMNPISRNAIFIIVCIYLVVIMVSTFKLLRINLEHSENAKVLENKILETQLKLKEQELNYLKMQIHPHFLFNTLNTMYGLAIKKAEQTPDMILKLSNLMDYLLYQADKPFVSLKEEIDHIDDYISLEKMRFNETLNVTFEKKNITEAIEIPPMLFIPFVENSFKHGVIKQGVLHIAIDIEVKAPSIYFSIKNTSDATGVSESGIGLDNIKKRLELLYKDDYKLSIEQIEGRFSVIPTKIPNTHV